MAEQDQTQFISTQTQTLFNLLTAAGADPVPLMALVSNAYADGGHHVLNEFEQRAGPLPAIG